MYACGLSAILEVGTVRIRPTSPARTADNSPAPPVRSSICRVTYIAAAILSRASSLSGRIFPFEGTTLPAGGERSVDSQEWDNEPCSFHALRIPHCRWPMPLIWWSRGQILVCETCLTGKETPNQKVCGHESHAN